MEAIIEKHLGTVMNNHPELSREEAIAIVQKFYALSRIVVDSYKKSSTNQ